MGVLKVWDGATWQPVGTGDGYRPGDIKTSPVATMTGYLPCDAAAVSRTTYADLFAAIGTTFGVGDGSTTFNTPLLVAKPADKEAATGIITAATNFSVGTQTAYRRNGWVHTFISLTRTTSTLSLSNPDHTNTTIGTVSDGWRPLYGTSGVTANGGSLRSFWFNTDGTVQITAGIAASSWTTADVLNTETLSASFHYPAGVGVNDGPWSYSLIKF